jgi:hypothetical protein
MHRTTLVIVLLVITLSLGVGVSTRAAAQGSDCPGTPTPRLVVGQPARVTPGLPNNLRSGAGIWNHRIGQIPGGGTVDVLAGPVCAGRYNWWQVNYRGTVGWTAEGIPGNYWLEPLGGAGNTPLLSLRVDPVVRKDGDFIVLAPDSLVTIMLSSTPPDASTVRFYLSTDSASTLIGTDTELRDGAIIQWRVPDTLHGYLSATVHNPNGHFINGTEHLGVAADGTVPPAAGTFTHSTLGFQLDLPAGWVAQETSEGVIISQHGTLQLLVTQAPPSGLPAGDRITFTGFATQLGIDLRRDNLVYQNRTKAAIYQYQGLDRIPIGGYTLFIMVTDTSPDYDAIDLSESVLQSIDQIVATLRQQ